MKRLKILILLTEVALPIEAGDRATTPWIAEESKADLFLSGPSRSRTLESLKLEYLFAVNFNSEARVDQTLRELFRASLEPNFRHGHTFSSLKIFDLCVSMTVDPPVSGPEAVKTEIEKCLPSIFGPGGRCEVDGWAASVDVDWSVREM